MKRLIFDHGSDETHECVSLGLSHGRWIADGLPSSRHITREEEKHETPSAQSSSNSLDVLSSILILIVITILING